MVKPRVPKVNWGHSLSKGLIFDFNPSERALNTQEKTRNLPLVNENSVAWSTGIFGPQINTTGGTTKDFHLSNTPSHLNSLVKWSAEFICQWHSAGGNNYGALMWKGTGYTGRYFSISNDNGTGGWGIRLVINWTGVGAWSISYPTPDVWQHYIITYDGTSSANVPKWYVNGLPVGVITRISPSGSLPTDGTDLYIGNGGDSTAGNCNWDGPITLSRLWNRILSPNEVKQLYIDPWQIYVRPKKFFPFIPSVTVAPIPSRIYQVNQSINRSNTF